MTEPLKMMDEPSLRMREGGFDGEEGSCEIDANDVFKGGFFGAACLGLSSDAGVCEDDVEVAEVLCYFANSSLRAAESVTSAR